MSKFSEPLRLLPAPASSDSESPRPLSTFFAEGIPGQNGPAELRRPVPVVATEPDFADEQGDFNPTEPIFPAWGRIDYPFYQNSDGSSQNSNAPQTENSSIVPVPPPHFSQKKAGDATHPPQPRESTIDSTGPKIHFSRAIEQPGGKPEGKNDLFGDIRSGIFQFYLMRACQNFL